jgi:nitrogenase subunit NifH
MKSVKERGLAKHIGFSAHCTPEELEKFIADYPEAELVQLQINYLDWESPSFRERECVEIARAHGLPIVAQIPRSDDITRCEDRGMTVIEGDQTLAVSQCFLDLAERLWTGEV